MTASSLRSLLLARGFAVTVEDGGLVINPEPHAELDRWLGVLHTGVRALVAGRAWFGSADATAKKPWVKELHPGKPLPSGVGLLCVEGDAEWDRLPIDAKLDCPAIFEREKTK